MRSRQFLFFITRPHLPSPIAPCHNVNRIDPMSQASQPLLKRFGLAQAEPPRFYRSLPEVEQNARAYSHLMRRAWETMDLDGILCVQAKPTVYFKEVKTITEEKLKLLHQRFWNQGTATLLVIASPKQVQVYSGMALPAKRDENVDDGDRLVATFEQTAELLEFVDRVELGQIYKDKPDCFREGAAIDKYLLKNLSATRDRLQRLDNKVPIKILHALLGRIIFTCYLTDRNIIRQAHFDRIGAQGASNLRELLGRDNKRESLNLLYKLFYQLREDFNGSMFDEEIEYEKRQISSEHVEVLRHFLDGDEIKSGQMSLGFWAYDFSVVPVETISAIYEEFLGAESQDGKPKSGAFYTPRHLAELVVDVATDKWPSLLDKKFLDCAVGSGIFLVILFNRIAEEWRRKNPKITNSQRADALINILQTQLRGIDISETACRITCFSLYLALLDQLKPRDIDILKLKHGKVLPKLLLLANDLDPPKTPVIYEGNFFDANIALGGQFDLVIGNPPWVGRKSDPMAYDWCKSPANPASSKAPKNEQGRASFLMPNKQIAHAFMWKAPLHARDDGKVCLLLPSKVFLEKTDRFQSGWFSSFIVDRIMHLSDMRFLLFENALCPATIAKYGPAPPPHDLTCKVEYVIPKASTKDPRRGVISIDQQDRWQLKLAHILQSLSEDRASPFWKKYYWSTPRDLRLIDKLLSLPHLSRLVGAPENHKRWVGGDGFQPFNEEKYRQNPKHYLLNAKPKPIFWSEGDKYLDARHAKYIKPAFLILPLDCINISNINRPIARLRRSPDQKIFNGPKVLSNKGFSWKAYCDFPVLFQDTIRSIAGPAEDSKLLMFLAAVLNSKLSKYFLFHTAANWGTERDVVQLFELFRMPFPLPDDTYDPGRSRLIIEENANIMINLRKDIDDKIVGRGNFIATAEATIEPLIYEYFEIHDRDVILVDDTCSIWEPSSTPNRISADIPALRVPAREDRKRYTDLLCKVLNEWAKRSTIKLRPEVAISKAKGIGIVSLIKGSAPAEYMESEAGNDLQSAIKRIKQILPESKGRIANLRGLTVFDVDRIHLIKPLTMRHWARSMALSDADEIAAAILSSGRNK
jgi:hypothetical protein